MKQTPLWFIAIALLTGTLFSQNPAPTETPDDSNAVVRIATNLIQLDVTVTDSKGKVATGLTADDFEVFENGEKQKVTNFSFRARSVGGVFVTDGNKNAPGGPAGAGQLGPASIRRSFAIVVDDLSLSFASVYYTRKALVKFVDEQMQPDDLVAIIRTGGGVGALQQFTSNKQLLHAAIEKIRWNPFGGSVDSLTSVAQNNVELTDRFRRESDAVASGNPKKFKSILTRDSVTDTKRTDYEITRNVTGQEKGVYAQRSLDTISYIVSGMKTLPGRKAMMLFSDGIDIGNDSAKGRGTSVLDYLQELAELANRSSVVIYTFDTKGLRSMSITASDSTYEVIGGHREQKESQRTKDFKDSQDGLAFIAKQTGGKALLDSSDLGGGIQRALDEQAGYYLLGYVPDAETFDPVKRKFNKIEIKVTRPGLKVSYRSGFFNSDGGSASPQTPAAGREMAEALTSPFAVSDITLQINALYADDPADGTYIRSFLHIAAKDLTFSEDAEGWKKATFDVTAVTFGDNGVPVENVDSKYTIKTKGATYDAMLKKGFVYVLIMPVKKPGVYQYRVALRDAASGKIGSASQVVEVPDLTKEKLAVSSVVVEGVDPVVWQNIVQGKVGTNPGQVHVASTVLYDTVLRQFPAGTVLRYGYEVYNARLDGSSLPHIETQLKILQNERVVVEGNVTKFDPATQPGARHLKISNAVMLKDSLPAGDYVLQVIVNDTVAKRKAYQLVPFEITAK